MIKQINKSRMLIATTFLTLSLTANAVVEYDQNITPDVIYGSGNANGVFTTDRNSTAKVEVGLRAKIPFVGTTNSNGDGTYSFTLAETDHDNDPGTANRWNFDFTINVDYLDAASAGANLDEFTYEMGLDSDPSGNTDFLVGDPIAANGFFAPDHSMGDNSTVNGGGAEAPIFPVSTYNTMLANNNVLQNSQGYATYAGAFPNGYDASVDGTYDIYFIVKLAGIQVARSDIQVIIGNGGAPANTAPITVSDSYAVAEDTTLSIANPNGVLANDSDNDGDTLAVSNPGVIAANNPNGGNITLFADGTFTYTPPADFNGDAIFDFSVTDGILLTNSFVTITVNPINDAPVTVVDTYIVNEDDTLTVINPNGVLANDADVDGDTISVVEVGTISAVGGVGGNITMAADGTFLYNTPADFNGSATFEFTVTDSVVVNPIASALTITVNSVNDAPSYSLFCDIDATDVTGGAVVTVQIPDFVYDMLTGPSNESSQTFTLAVAIASGSDPDSIINNTSIDNAGSIGIDFNVSNSGVATLEITMQDDGNTDFGGVDSTVLQFNVHHYADLELDPTYSGLQLNDVLYKNTFDPCR